MHRVRLGTRLGAFMAALLLSLATLLLVATPAQAQQAYGTKILNAGDWLNGAGVDVYANGSSSYVSNDYAAPAVGMRWQCVELPQRLYKAKNWYSGMFPGVGVAADIWGQAPSMGMSRQSNGSINSITPGDMIIHGYGFFGGAGHVAVVDSVSGSTVSVVEQNFSTTGRATYAISGGTLSRSGTSDIMGVVHDPDNSGTVAGGSGRMLIANEGAELWAKDDLSYGGWQNQNGTAVRMAIGGNRMMMLNTGAQVWAKDSLSYGGWSYQGAAANEIAVGSSGRMMIMVGSHVWAKDSFGEGGWIDQNVDATRIRIGGSRMVVTTSDNKVWAKDTVSPGGWIDQGVNEPIGDVQVGPTGRMAIINSGGYVWAKDSLSTGGWQDQSAFAHKIAVGGGGRMMILNEGNYAYAKDSLGYGGWADMGAIGNAVAVGSSGRVLLTDTNNHLWAKDTLGSGGWHDLNAVVTAFGVG